MRKLRRKTSRTLAIFTTLTASVAVPQGVFAGTNPHGVSFEVTVEIGGDGNALHEAIDVEVAQQLSQDPGFEQRANAEIRVVIGVGWIGESRGDYAVTAEVRSGQDSITDTSGLCEMCSSAELLHMVRGQIGWALHQLPRAAPIPVDPPRKIAQDLPSTPEPELKRVGPLGWTGVALGTVGIGTAVAGAVLLGKGEQTALNRNVSFLEVTDYRPAGRAALGVGSAAVLAGGAMFVIDLVRRKSSRRRVAIMPVVPTLNGGTTGAALVGRF